MTGRYAILIGSTCIITGCSGNQSILNPAGPIAQSIAVLTWVLLAGGLAIFLLVLGILSYVLTSSPERRARISGNRLILGGGVILPVVVLAVLLIYVFRVGAQITRPPEDPLVVEVTAHQFWWEFRYLPDEGGQVVTANELHIPVGRPVELRLQSADVIHTFWVPQVAGKRDIIPGVDNTLVVEADRTGLFRGQCNEFCGAQHALMGLHVFSVPEADFRDWLNRQRQPAAPPRDEFLAAGRDAFFAEGCQLCHTVRGTGARGSVGPDLTHFGSRRTIAAGTLRNTQGNREAWIVSAQHIKPENKMPDMPVNANNLRALAAYLGSLQ